MIKLLVSVQVAQCVGGLLWFYVMATRDWEQEGMKVRGALDHITTSVQFSSVMSDSLQPHGLQHATLPYHHQLLELTQTHIHWVDDAIQTSHPLLPLSSSAFDLSQHQGLFQWVSSSHQVAKVFKFQLQHQSFQRIFSVDFFRIDWINLLAVQGTLKCLIQHHSSKASVLWWSAFFMIQFSPPYVTTGQTIVLTTWNFVSKVMSLLFNTLSRFAIAFLPRRNCLLISWLQSLSSVILSPRKESLSLFPLFPHLFAMKWWDQMPWS